MGELVQTALVSDLQPGQGKTVSAGSVEVRGGEGFVELP